MVEIVSFSGGKDSTAMLLILLEKGFNIDEIIFCDTGKEFPDMLKHIDKVEKYIGRQITRIKSNKSFDYLFSEQKRSDKSKYKNIKGYGWSSATRRWCTTELKKRVFNDYIKQKYGKDYTLYIGLAFDEQKRVKRNKDTRIKYPLVDWEMTEQQALQYCYNKGFNWNGLYNHFKRVSCYLCPLQSKSDWLTLKKNYTELYNDAIKLDEISCFKFSKNETLRERVERWEKKELEKEKQGELL